MDLHGFLTWISYIYMLIFFSYFSECRIHVYNVEELILCALPYHDTHAFVRVVQLIDTGWENNNVQKLFVLIRLVW